MKHTSVFFSFLKFDWSVFPFVEKWYLFKCWDEKSAHTSNDVWRKREMNPQIFSLSISSTDMLSLFSSVEFFTNGWMFRFVFTSWLFTSQQSVDYACIYFLFFCSTSLKRGFSIPFSPRLMSETRLPIWIDNLKKIGKCSRFLGEKWKSAAVGV